MLSNSSSLAGKASSTDKEKISWSMIVNPFASSRIHSFLRSRGLRSKIGMRSKQEAGIADCIKLGANQNHHRDHKAPDQQRDGRRHRSVDHVVIGEASQIYAKDDGGGKPKYSGQNRSREHA